MQRTLMLTEDLLLATQAQQASELERIDMDITFALSAVGLSLVNNSIQKEVAYVALTNSGVVWEERKKKKKSWKSIKMTDLIEEGYQQYNKYVKVGKKDCSKIQLPNKAEVDFGQEPVKLLKPYESELRRNFREGFWLQYRYSEHQTQIHAKLHYIQVLLIILLFCILCSR